MMTVQTEKLNGNEIKKKKINKRKQLFLLIFSVHVSVCA